MSRQRMAAFGTIATTTLVVATLAISACSPTTDAGRAELDQPVNCRTAEGDLRVLESERKHVEEQRVAGVTSLIPAGAVVGIVTGTEDDNLKVLSGEYDKQLTKKIALIKKTCKLS